MEEQEGGEEQTPQLGAEEAEMMERLQEEIRNLPVSDHLLYMMHSLSGLAVGRLGLTADTASRRDLGQARLAIDAFKTLLELVEKVRPAAEMVGHRSMLSQLQLAYVGALEPGAPGGTASEDAETPLESVEPVEEPDASPK